MKALLTDASFRQALTVTRSLGRRDIFVGGVDDADKNDTDILSFQSKYCRAKFFLPSYRKDPNGFVDRLLKIARDFDVLIPISTQAILTIAKHLKEFQKITALAIPDYETVGSANCKDKLLKIAKNIGIPTPETFYIESLSEIEPLANRLSYPVVIKYRSDEGLYLAPVNRYMIVYSKEQLLSDYLNMHQIQAFPLIQEYIEGTGYGFFALFDNNFQAKAIFCHRRIREYPISGGASSCCVSIRDETLIEYGLKLLKALRWYGVAMVEFKKDNRDGQFKLMEINPRFWGSSPLSIYCGVDFPYLLFKVAKGEDFNPVTTYKLGVKMRFLCLDLLSAKDYFFKTKNRFSFLRDFIKDILNPKIKDGILSLDDPNPGIAYLYKYLPMYLKKYKVKDVGI